MSTSTPEFQAAVAAEQAAAKQMSAAIKTLPELPATGHECAGRWADLKVTTVFLAQSCTLEFEVETYAEFTDEDPDDAEPKALTGRWHASTDGWDDMGDMDGPAYAHCYSCGANFQVPTDLDWN